MLASNTLLQNRYLVLRPIGRGGMGTVYEATDTRLHATVALKQTLLTDSISRRAFEREAHLLARLRHQALPKVIDHFTEEDGQFLVMEYIQGDDLAALMEKRGGRFPPSAVVPWVLQWGDQLLDALDYLHAQAPPVYHRDIKPQNLKLTQRGDIILLDFGLAKGGLTEMSTLTARGERMLGFTPNYAPLEQIRGGDPDPRSDLYSLAATLYNLLTGVKPPDALTRVAALLNDQPDPLRPASEYNEYVTESLAAVLHQALSPNTDDRPSSAREMRRVLQEVRSGKDSPVIQGVTMLATTSTSALSQRLSVAATLLTPSDPNDETTTHSMTLKLPVNHSAPPAIGTLLETFQTGTPVLCLAISPDGQSLAAGCEDGTIGLWNIQAGEPIHTLEGHRRRVSSVAFSPDGKTLASGSEDTSICLWGIRDGQLLYRAQECNEPVESVTFSPDGLLLAFGGWNEAVFLSQVQENTLMETIEMPSGFVHSLSFSRDGAMLAAGCYDTTVRLWRMSDRSPIHTLSEHQNFVLSIAFSPNGKTLASGGGETGIRLWRVKDGRLMDVLKGHTNFVRSLAFSPDGKTLASGSEDKTIRLWRASDGSPLHKFEGHTEGVTSVVYSPDGQMLISGSRDSKIRLWQAC